MSGDTFNIIVRALSASLVVVVVIVYQWMNKVGVECFRFDGSVR